RRRPSPSELPRCRGPWGDTSVADPCGGWGGQPVANHPRPSAAVWSAASLPLGTTCRASKASVACCRRYKASQSTVTSPVGMRCLGHPDRSAGLSSTLGLDRHHASCRQYERTHCGCRIRVSLTLIASIKVKIIYPATYIRLRNILLPHLRFALVSSSGPTGG